MSYTMPSSNKWSIKTNDQSTVLIQFVFINNLHASFIATLDAILWCKGTEIKKVTSQVAKTITHNNTLTIEKDAYTFHECANNWKSIMGNTIKVILGV